jgi:hypothetical protein
MLNDEGREVKPVSAGADKYVNKFVEIARKKKEERNKRLAEEAAAAEVGPGAVDAPVKEEEDNTKSKLVERKQTGYAKTLPKDD